MKRSFWPWLGLLVFFLWQFQLFDRMVSRDQAWVYPRWNDQIQYLTESYTGYEYARENGFAAGVWQTLVNPSAQGTLHDFFALLVFKVTGPSRSAALSINLLFLLFWEGLLFVGIRRLSGSWALAWGAIGLFLTLNSGQSLGPGSMIDFRLDWMAACAFGSTLVLGWLTNGFRHRGWSLAFGCSVGITVLIRFITAAYLGPIFLGFALWLLGRSLLRKAGAGARLLNWGLASLAALALSAPIFWVNHTVIYNYYWIGHLYGPESALRAPNYDWSGSLGFIFDSLNQLHLGLTFTVAAGLGLVWGILPLARRSPARVPAVVGSSSSASPGSVMIWSAIFLVVPILILAAHPQKSPYVLGVLVPGVLGLVLGLWLYLDRWVRVRCENSSWPALGAVLLCGIGAVHFSLPLIRPPHSDEFIRSARKVNEVASYMLTASQRAKLTTPRIAVDQITDSLDAQIMRVVCYERFKVWMPFMMTLPTGIAEADPKELRERLRQSDFVFITESMPGNGYWPYDRQMQLLHPEFKAWCQQHLRLVETFALFDRTMSLYERRELSAPAP